MSENAIHYKENITRLVYGVTFAPLEKSLLSLGNEVRLASLRSWLRLRVCHILHRFVVEAEKLVTGTSPLYIAHI